MKTPKRSFSLIAWIKENWMFLIILGLAIFLRVYKPYEWFMYTHDQDLAAWTIKDIVFDRHIRLIGQETSSKGVFIGPLFYYLQIPFYWLANWDPVGSIWLPVALSTFGIWSYYVIFKKIFNKQVGLIAALIYSMSYVIIFTDREVAPTMIAMIWTVWFLDALWRLLTKDQKAYVLLGILGGLIWHINLALALLSPLVILAQVFSKQKLNVKYLAIGLVSFLLLMAPFFAFEIRHNFIQVKAISASFTTQKDYVQGTATGVAKLDRVMQLVFKNTTNIFWGTRLNVSQKGTLYFLVGLFIFLLIKRRISWQMGVLMILWQILFVIFFTTNSINTSEYYLNGMNVIWILIASLGIEWLFLKNKHLAIIIILFFAVINFTSFFSRVTNESGYLQRKAIVDYIANDSRERDYPCVAVSYITTPGNQLGYRYFFYQQNLHVNQPKSESPVYTIVFPHNLVSRLDKTFGALGLIFPDYDRYNEQQVKASCAGENANLTEPMFGLPK